MWGNWRIFTNNCCIGRSTLKHGARSFFCLWKIDKLHNSSSSWHLPLLDVTHSTHYHENKLVDSSYSLNSSCHDKSVFSCSLTACCRRSKNQTLEAIEVAHGFLLSSQKYLLSLWCESTLSRHSLTKMFWLRIWDHCFPEEGLHRL